MMPGRSTLISCTSRALCFFALPGLMASSPVALSLAALSVAGVTPAVAAAPNSRSASPSSAALNARAQADEGPRLLGKFGEWGAYTANPKAGKVCFILGKPTKSATVPPGRNRDPAMLYVSTRPKEKVKEEVSVDIGYPFQAGSDATAAVGPASFAMYTDKEGAFIKNPAEEARLVDAMRKGSDLIVSGTSSHGTKTTDTFSLKGISQALSKIAAECQ